MIAPGLMLDGLKRQRPEWQPWLAVVEEVVREASAASWDGTVPAGISVRASGAPRLAGAAVTVPARATGRLLERLIRIASKSGTPKMTSLEAALVKDLDVLQLFAASVSQRADRIEALAAGSGADAEALQAVAALVPVPFLQACNRAWAGSISESWMESYCPVCGSWPAFAEVRGIERSRYLRCARCGGGWQARILHCPYCANRDHDDLAVLVPEKAGVNAVIEACKRCLGYVKTFTRLQGCPPAAVMLEDLASVDLDVAALEQGYARPPGAGYSVEVTVSDKGARRRFFA
jgi:FdhE protein